MSMSLESPARLVKWFFAFAYLAVAAPLANGQDENPSQTDPKENKEEDKPVSRWDALRERGKSAGESLRNLAEENAPAIESIRKRADELRDDAEELREQAEAFIREQASTLRGFLLSDPDDATTLDEEEAATGELAERAGQQRPAGFSLRPAYKRLGLDIKDQGRRGSCTIFGTLGVMEFHYAMRGNPVRLSEQFAAWAAADVSGRKNKLEGYNFRHLVQGIKTHGVCTEELMPYDTKRVGRPSSEAMADAATRRSISETIFQRYREAGRRDGFTEQTLNAICWSIAEQHPVTAAMAWPANPEVDDEGNMIWNQRSRPPSGHVVVFVGYEIDDRWPGGGRLEMRNSWGERWGRDGYAFVDFEYLKKFGMEAIAIKAF